MKYLSILFLDGKERSYVCVHTTYSLDQGCIQKFCILFFANVFFAELCLERESERQICKKK